MDLARTVYSRDLKLAAMHALDAGGTTGEVARRYQLSPKLIERWRGEWRAKGEAAFPGIGYRGNSLALDDARRIAELERKIGQLTMENDLLKKALRRLVAALKGATASSHRCWRSCLFQEVRQAASEGKAVNALCERTGLSRAGYYRWRRPQPISTVDMELRDELQRVALQFPAYGYRRITAELHRRGFDVNHKRALRLMRADNLLCLRRRSFVVTTDSRHDLPVYANLARSMTPNAVNQLWGTSPISAYARSSSIWRCYWMPFPGA